MQWSLEQTLKVLNKNLLLFLVPRFSTILFVPLGTTRFLSTTPVLYPMRVEGAGALSPAADLLAFSLALAVTMGLAMSLSDMVQRDGAHDRIMAGDLSNIAGWPALDPEGAGTLRFPDEEMRSGLPLEGAVPGLRGDVLVNVTCRGWSCRFLLSEGRFAVYDPQVRTVTAIHSIMVLVQLQGATYPGTLSACYVEVLK